MLKRAVQGETMKITQTSDCFSKLKSGTTLFNTEYLRHPSARKMDGNVAKMKDLFMKTLMSQSATLNTWNFCKYFQKWHNHWAHCIKSYVNYFKGGSMK